MIILDPQLLFEFRLKGRCEWCSKARPVNAHHIFCRGLGGGSRLDVAINLIALCPFCHSDFHNGHIARYDLLAIVAKREGKLQDEIVTEIYRLLRTPKTM
jgi:hypothetical protein